MSASLEQPVCSECGAVQVGGFTCLNCQRFLGNTYIVTNDPLIEGPSRQPIRCHQCAERIVPWTPDTLTDHTLHTYVFALAHSWHPNCLRCTECSEVITDDAFVADDDNRPFHRRCLSNERVKCFKCGEAIEEMALIVRASTVSRPSSAVKPSPSSPSPSRPTSKQPHAQQQQQPQQKLRYHPRCFGCDVCGTSVTTAPAQQGDYGASAMICEEGLVAHERCYRVSGLMSKWSPAVATIGCVSKTVTEYAREVREIEACEANAITVGPTLPALFGPTEAARRYYRNVSRPVPMNSLAACKLSDTHTLLSPTQLSFQDPNASMSKSKAQTRALIEFTRQQANVALVPSEINEKENARKKAQRHYTDAPLQDLPFKANPTQSFYDNGPFITANYYFSTVQDSTSLVTTHLGDWEANLAQDRREFDQVAAETLTQRAASGFFRSTRSLAETPSASLLESIQNRRGVNSTSAPNQELTSSVGQGESREGVLAITAGPDTPPATRKELKKNEAITKLSSKLTLPAKPSHAVALSENDFLSVGLKPPPRKLTAEELAMMSVFSNKPVVTKMQGSYRVDLDFEVDYSHLTKAHQRMEAQNLLARERMVMKTYACDELD